MPAWKCGVVLPVLLTLPACAGEQTARPDAQTIVYEMRKLERTLRECPENLAPCASIALDFPVIQEAPSPAARAEIEGHIRSVVLAPLEEGLADSTAEQLMERFLSGYQEFAEDFPEQSSQWVMTRKVDVIHNAGGVFSVESTEASYTGGAHPNTSVVLASFDARTGSRITLDDLLVEGYGPRLEGVAERAFRAERGLTETEDLSSAGFWFENGTFRLNENFAVVPEGLKFYFNAYEVGPYSMGPTSIVLDNESILPLLRAEGPFAATAGSPATSD